MKVIKTISFVILAVLVSTSSSAMINKVGSAGALFLRINMDTRTAAMGEACGAVVCGAPSVFQNPAGLALTTTKQLMLSDTEWIADIRLIGGVYAFPYGNDGAIAVSAVCVDYGEMPAVSEYESDVITGTFRPMDIAIGISYGRRWTDKLLVGGTLRYIDQDIADTHSRGYAFDFGTIYYTGFRTLRLAMSTNNFGPDMSFDGAYVDRYYIGTAHIEREQSYGEYDLPLNFRIGLAYDFEISPMSKLTLAFDATHPNDYSVRFSIGVK